MLSRPLLISMLLAIATAAAAPAALAFDRPFPTYAKRGTMFPDLYPKINIDGRPRFMTAGARIYNADNMIEMPASLPSRNVVVNYTEDDSHQIERVWILTDEEARQSTRQQNINQPR